MMPFDVHVLLDIETLFIDKIGKIITKFTFAWNVHSKVRNFRFLIQFYHDWPSYFISARNCASAFHDFVKTRLNIHHATKRLYVDIAACFVRCKRLFIRRPGVLSPSHPPCLLYNNSIILRYSASFQKYCKHTKLNKELRNYSSLKKPVSKGSSMARGVYR